MKKKFRRWLVPTFAAVLSLAAAIPALADETVSVTVPNVKGGYLEVTYERNDGSRVYLPIGETVQVPKGTSLSIYAGEIYYYDADENYIRTKLSSLSANGEALELNDWGGGAEETFTAEENTTFEAAFKGEISEVSTSTNTYPLRFTSEKSSQIGLKNPGTAVNEEVSIYNRNNRQYVSLNNAKDVVIVGQRYYPFEGRYDDELQAFKLEGGRLTTNGQRLDAGEYYVTVTYTYNSEECRSSLWIYVDERVMISGPIFAVWNYKTGSSSWSSNSIGDYREYLIDDSSTDTVKKYFDMYKNDTEIDVIANHETMTGVGSYNYQAGSYEIYPESDKISKYMDEYGDTAASLDVIPANFKPAVIAHLDPADIMPESVKKGWNLLNGKWYFYRSEDPSSLAKNEWLSIGEEEEVWVGADGAMAVNTTVKFGGTTWLVDAEGHKVKNKTTTVDGVDYITDGDGVVIDTKIHLATPSNADEAISQVDKVLENQDSMSQEDKEKAADMLTEALKKDIDVTKLTAEEISKYEELYKAAFGADNIIVDPAQSGAIVAAGLTSADFESGSVTIEYASGWLGSSSNAQERVEIKLLVNGAERTPLSAPVTVEIELPEEFIASYSNATYNFEVKDARDVTVDTENGVLKMTVTRAGIFEIKAVLKQTYRPSGGKSSSSKGGRATVAANYQKSGQWILNNVGWWYRYDDGTWPAGTWAYLPWQNESKWYYFNADGYMVTGWHYWNSNYYYLYPIADGNRGYMFTGWHEIGGKWYYFSDRNDISLGAMAYNTTTPDGYKVDKDGAWMK